MLLHGWCVMCITWLVCYVYYMGGVLCALHGWCLCALHGWCLCALHGWCLCALHGWCLCALLGGVYVYIILGMFYGYNEIVYFSLYNCYLIHDRIIVYCCVYIVFNHYHL